MSNEYRLQDETRSQAIDRWHNEGGNEADYIRAVPITLANGETDTLIHCNICGAQQYHGYPPRHLHYCPFAPEASRPVSDSSAGEGDR